MARRSKIPPIVLRRPVDDAWRITARFGDKGPHWKRGWHTGTDFATPVGTECYACADGFIQIVHDNKDGLGLRIWIACDTRSGLIRVCYAHLSRSLVMVGSHIKEGQAIGFTGNSGNSTGPHLHFEVRSLPQDRPVGHDFYNSTVDGFVSPI